MEKRNKLSIEINSRLDSEYVQKLAFKAGYNWRNNAGETVHHLDSNQLIFTKDKEIEFNNNVLRADRFNPTLSFPKDAEKIHGLFTTPEYKVGDYVVLVEKRPSSWNCSMDKFLNSTQKIESVSENGYIEFWDTLGNWSYKINDIARHATEDEIKKYNEGGDVYIGEYKVECLNNGIKVGCVTLTKHQVKAISAIFGYTKANNGSFLINKNGIEFIEGGLMLNDRRVEYFPGDGKGHGVSEEQLNKIIKKVEK